MWTWVYFGHRTKLRIFRRGSLTSVWYRDEILESTLRLYTTVLGPTFVLIDYNARPHRAVILNVYLESKGIVRMEWQS